VGNVNIFEENHGRPNAPSRRAARSKIAKCPLATGENQDITGDIRPSRLKNPPYASNPLPGEFGNQGEVLVTE
jgi:hypothetical protein